MLKKFNIIKEILRHKNSQLKLEREKTMAEQSMNIILSAYLAMLVDKQGTVSIPKSRISEALGKYRVIASSFGDNYIISVVPMNMDIGDGRGEK